MQSNSPIPAVHSPELRKEGAVWRLDQYMRDGSGVDFLRELKDACGKTSGARQMGIPLDSMAITAAPELGATDRGTFLSLALGT